MDANTENERLTKEGRKEAASSSSLFSVLFVALSTQLKGCLLNWMNTGN